MNTMARSLLLLLPHANPRTHHPGTPRKPRSTSTSTHSCCTPNFPRASPKERSPDPEAMSPRSAPAPRPAHMPRPACTHTCTHTTARARAHTQMHHPYMASAQTLPPPLRSLTPEDVKSHRDQSAPRVTEERHRGPDAAETKPRPPPPPPKKSAAAGGSAQWRDAQ